MKVAIIAAYNEEDTIGSVVLRTKRYVDKVLVVDDGSKDKTGEIAQLAGAIVVQHLTNGGKGEALKTGFEAVKKLNPDVVVCLDADCQHDPDDIPKVIAPILSGEAEMVIASRYIDGEHKKKVPKYRRFGLWVLTTTTNLGSEKKITDTQCGFRAFSGAIIDKFSFQNKGFSVESEMLEDAIENNVRIKEVSTIVRYDGLDTSTEKPGKHGLGVLNFILRTAKERHPLLFFGVSGVILLLIGLVFTIFSLDSYFRNGHIPFGPTLAAAVAVLLGALSAFAGLILNSIAGMIHGLKRLSLSQDKKLFDYIDEKKVPERNSLSLLQSEMLLRNINGQNIPQPTTMDHNLGDILPSNVNGQKIPGLVMLNPSHKEGYPENIIGLNIPGPTVLNHNHDPNFIDEPNGKEILELSQLINNDKEFVNELSDEQNIHRPQHLNNYRRVLVLKDIDDKKIQI